MVYFLPDVFIIYFVAVADRRIAPPSTLRSSEFIQVIWELPSCLLASIVVGGNAEIAYLGDVNAFKISSIV